MSLPLERGPAPLDAATIGVLRALARLARVIERAGDELNLAQYRVLVAIASGDERASRVATRLAIGKPTVSAIVEALHDRGLVPRVRSPPTSVSPSSRSPRRGCGRSRPPRPRWPPASTRSPRAPSTRRGSSPSSPGSAPHSTSSTPSVAGEPPVARRRAAGDGPGWVRRLWGYMLRHRRRRRALARRRRARQRLPDRRSARRARRSSTASSSRTRSPLLAVAGRSSVALAVASLRLRLRAALPRRPGRPRGPVRPAQRHARPPAGDGLRQPRPDADRPARRAGQLRLDARAGAAQLLPDHERQRPADAAVARRDVLPLAAARRREPRRRSRPARRLATGCAGGSSRPPGTASSARATSPRSSTRTSTAFGSSRRSARSSASSSASRDASKVALRLADARRAAPVALPAASRGHPDARPGRHPRPRRVAGPPPRDHARHVPRLLHLRHPAGGARPASSPGVLTIGQQARAGVERIFQLLDLKPGDRRSARRGRAAARLQGDVTFANVHFAYGDGAPVLRGFDLHDRARRARRPRRAERERQVDARDAGAALLRPDRGRGPRRRPRRARRRAASRCAARSASSSRRASCSPTRCASNIAYGRPDATEAEIEAAARAAAGPRLHRGAAARLRHRRRRARPDPLGRPAPAHRARPGHPRTTRAS